MNTSELFPLDDYSAEPGRPSPEPKYHGREGHPYRVHQDLVHAARAAHTLGRPLLLTGDPGCGKTDFAFAVARRWAEHRGHKWDPINDAFQSEHGLLECYIRSDTRAKDLLYSYDAVRRFSDAYQAEGDRRTWARDPRRYLQLEPFGRALVASDPRVVLVDEIDKAPRDLSNDLLREFDQGWFEIPEIEEGLSENEPDSEEAPPTSYGVALCRSMGARHRKPASKPFIIVTSNAERQLPDAFLRRCVFFHVPFPEKDQLTTMLHDRFTSNRPNTPGADPEIRKMATDAFLETASRVFDAIRTRQGLIKKPATSELMEWVEAFLRLQAPKDRTLFEMKNKDDVDFTTVPYLSCLVKLTADLENLKEG